MTQKDNLPAKLTLFFFLTFWLVLLTLRKQFSDIIASFCFCFLLLFICFLCYFLFLFLFMFFCVCFLSNTFELGITQPAITSSKLTIRREICSKLIIKTSERRHWHRSDVSIVNLEHILHLALVFLL